MKTRTNLTISIHTEYQNYIKILKNEYNINISALVRSAIKKEYEKLKGIENVQR